MSLIYSVSFDVYSLAISYFLNKISQCLHPCLIYPFTSKPAQIHHKPSSLLFGPHIFLSISQTNVTHLHPFLAASRPHYHVLLMCYMCLQGYYRLTGCTSFKPKIINFSLTQFFNLLTLLSYLQNMHITIWQNRQNILAVFSTMACTTEIYIILKLYL